MTQVKIDTNLGEMTIELNSEAAPNTVANFLSYVDDGFYADTIFHRVIKGFMIQGGGFETGMMQKETKSSIDIESDNGLSNERGTIAMARTMDPNSATSQFFINHKDNSFLNYTAPNAQGYGYTVFGKLIDGETVLDKIADVSTGVRMGHQDVPNEDVIIKNITRI